jgi:hypothetical protein
MCRDESELVLPAWVKLVVFGIPIGALMVLICVMMLSSVYIDESSLPGDLPTKELGKKYPRIIVDGQKLDFDAADGWYHYAGTDVRAGFMVLSTAFDDNPATANYVLATPDRKNPVTGATEIYKDGKWIPDPSALRRAEKEDTDAVHE